MDGSFPYSSSVRVLANWKSMFFVLFPIDSIVQLELFWCIQALQVQRFIREPLKTRSLYMQAKGFSNMLQTHAFSFSFSFLNFSW